MFYFIVTVAAVCQFSVIKSMMMMMMMSNRVRITLLCEIFSGVEIENRHFRPAVFRL